MPRGGANQTKIHYKGKVDDFIIFVDDAKAAKDWLSDSSIPLAQVVSSFQIFTTDKYVVHCLPLIPQYPAPMSD